MRTGLLFALLLVALLALFAASVPGHALHVDEAWIGEQAFHVAHGGVARSELFLGHARLEERAVLGHWLTVRLGAAVVFVFGWGLETLRSVSLGAGAALVVLLAAVARRSGASAAATLAVLCALLLMPPVFRAAKIYRPEILTALFGLASYACVLRSTARGSVPWAAAAGLLAGVAVLTHLNGLLYVAAGWAALLVRFRKAPLLAFPAAAAAGFAPYAWEMLRHYDLLRLQAESPFLSNKLAEQSPPWLNLLDEHKRFFRKLEIIPVTLAFLAAVLPGFADRVRRHPVTAVYLGVLLVGLGVMEAKDVKYAVLVLPWFALAIGRSAYELWERGAFRIPAGGPGAEGLPAWIARRIRPAALLLFAAVGLGYAVGQAAAPREDPAARHTPVGDVLVPGTRVLAPTAFVFDELTRHQVLSLLGPREEAHGTLTVDRLLKFLRDRDVEAMVLDETWRGRIVDLEEGWDRLSARYVPRDPVGDFTVLERATPDSIRR